MRRFFDSLEYGLRRILLVLVAGIVLAVTLQIVARFILLVSIPWTDELSRYLMVWSAFVGFGVAYRKGQLIYVGLVKDKLPPRMLRLATILSDILCAIFAVIAVIYGIKLCLLNVGQVSPSLRISLGIIYAAIPLGCFLFLVFVFESLFVPRGQGEVRP